MLGFTIALGGLARTAAVTVIVAVVAGSARGCSRPRTPQPSAPGGLVFGFATYLVARGVLSRRRCTWWSRLLVLAIYGSTLLFGLVPTPGISWQGHLFGAIGGVVAAWAIHTSTRQRISSSFVTVFQLRSVAATPSFARPSCLASSSGPSRSRRGCRSRGP